MIYAPGFSSTAGYTGGGLTGHTLDLVITSVSSDLPSILSCKVLDMSSHRYFGARPCWVAKSQQGLAPKYLCELMSKPPSSRSSRPLRSADRCDLLIPWSRTSLSQNRAFAVMPWWVLHYGMTLLLHLGV